MAGRQCEKRLWLEVHRRDLIAYDPDVKHRLAVGEDVNVVARAQHPGGVLIEYDDGAARGPPSHRAKDVLSP